MRFGYRHGILQTMATEQIAVRLPIEELAALDDLVDEGIYPNRTAAVRAGVRAIADLEKRRRIDAAIVDGYRRLPPTHAEDETALASLRDAIAEEPW